MYELDYIKIFKKLLKRKWLILFSIIPFSIGALVFSILQSNIYKSTAVLVPVDNNALTSASQAAGRLSGLASLAGISLSRDEASKVVGALEVAKNWYFQDKVISKYNLAPAIYGSDGWDASTQKLVYDQSIFNEKERKWVKGKPSSWELYKSFKNNLLIEQEQTTGLVYISYEHYSPLIAKEVVDILIDEINESARSKDKTELQSKIKYLSKEVSKTDLSYMKEILYRLIEMEYQKLVLTNVSEEYLLKRLSPAMIPEEKVRPIRSLICILGSILGLIFGVTFALLLPEKG